MALETDILAAISLAGIAMTVIFVVVINFFVWKKENKKPKEQQLSK
jgi:cbb3-type cytochrome oxidase subunit 3